MKFNQALIAAVAASAMLLSPVFAAYDCNKDGRDATGGSASPPTQITECGACLTDHCPTSDNTALSNPFVCQKIDPNTQECAPGPTFGVQCKAATHEDLSGTCVEKTAHATVKSECLTPDSQNAGKIVMLSGAAPVCGCEHGEEKVTVSGKESTVCKCPNAAEVRNPADGKCGPRPKFDCSTIGRNDGANPAAVFSADACGDCKTVADCKVGKDKSDKAYKCLTAPKDSKCNAPELTITCDGEFTYDPANNVCVAKQAAPPAPGNTTEPPKTETLPEKCKKINRKVDGEKCGACLDNYASLKTDDVASRCYPHADKTKCEDKAKTTKRVFDETLKLCKCPEGMNPSADGKESSIDDVCKSAAGQLVISSIVLLSSVAASALFFL